MWGLLYSDIDIMGIGSNTILIPLEEPAQYMIPIFLSGIFSAIIILFFSIISIVIAKNLKKNKKETKKNGINLIEIGVLIFVAAIIYIIAVEITFSNYLESTLSDLDEYYLDYINMPKFWDVYDPGFAIIGPIIGAMLIIIAGVVIIYLNSREIIR